MIATVTIRCKYCGRFRLPSEITKLSESISMCHRCINEAPERASRLINMPDRCEECDKSLFAQDDKTSVGVANVIWQDGRFHVTCTACGDKWEQRRADLFRGTQYGREKWQMN